MRREYMEIDAGRLENNLTVFTTPPPRVIQSRDEIAWARETCADFCERHGTAHTAAKRLRQPKDAEIVRLKLKKIAA